MLTQLLEHPFGALVGTFLLILLFVMVATSPSSYFRRKPTLTFRLQLILATLIVGVMYAWSSCAATIRTISS